MRKWPWPLAFPEPWPWPGPVLGALSAAMISFRLQTTLVGRNRYHSSRFRGEETETHTRTLDLGQATGKWNLCVIFWVPAILGLGEGGKLKTLWVLKELSLSQHLPECQLSSSMLLNGFKPLFSRWED